MSGREKTAGVNEALCFKSELKFAKILNEGLEQSMLILCLYVGSALFCALPTYIFTAWEYCFFYVHLIKAFGDALVHGRKATKSHVFFYCIVLPLPPSCWKSKATALEKT